VGVFWQRKRIDKRHRPWLGANRVDSNPEREDPGQQPGGSQAVRRSTRDLRIPDPAHWLTGTLRYDRNGELRLRGHVHRTSDLEGVINPGNLKVEAL